MTARVKQHLTLAEAAKVARVTERDIRRAVMAGKLDVVRRADRDGPCLVSRASVLRAVRLEWIVSRRRPVGRILGRKAPSDVPRYNPAVLLDAVEAARYVGCNADSIARLVRKGKLVPAKRGSRGRGKKSWFRRADWIRSRTLGYDARRRAPSGMLGLSR